MANEPNRAVEAGPMLMWMQVLTEWILQYLLAGSTMGLDKGVGGMVRRMVLVGMYLVFSRAVI